MHLQNGYGNTDLTPRPHPLLLPPDTPSLPTNFPILPPPPPPNLDPSQQFPPHQFQLFWQHDQQPQPQQQQQTLPVVVDPNFPLNFRAGMDAGTASPHNLIGLVGGGDDFTSFPPPSVVVAPQPLCWINQEDPLWKCIHKSEPQISTMDAQFGDRFGGASSKPEIDNHYSQSPGSVSEIYESAQWPSHDNGLEGGVVKEKMKKKKKHECCTEEEENKLERELTLMARFIEGQLMAHQDRLHRRFMAAIERMERERRERESLLAVDAEADRVQAAARVHEQALASSREAVIVSYLERISGQKIVVDRGEGRWPRAEVEALIRARSGLETRFREPGLKAGIWEEVSGLMVGMGFRRRAKRCKEKWENINKYFRKANDDGREGRRMGKRSKVCSYFDQLDQHHNNSRAQAMPVDRVDDVADDGNGDSTPPDSSSYNDEDDKSLGDQLDEDNKG